MPAVIRASTSAVAMAGMPYASAWTDSTTLWRFYTTFPAAVAETTADGAVGWEGIRSWGDAEWATKTGKIIGTYSKKADRAAKKGKTGAEADFRKSSPARST